MTNTPRNKKFWMGALLALVAVGGFTGISQAVIGQRAEDRPGDISGPCDEAENANDPRCTGTTAATGGRSSSTTGPTTTAPSTTQTSTTQPTTSSTVPSGGVDISGPCDEAEHANDPRCTGAQVGDPDDDDADHSGRGRGRGRGRGGDDDRHDSSGPGSGRDDDSSGPGSGHDDDSSGPGSGDDDDSSGHSGHDDSDDD